MIRALIFDDDPNAIEYLHGLVKNSLPKITEVFSTTDEADAQQYLTSNNPQLLFLDVEMPGVSGFEFLEKQKLRNFHVIFTTAFSKYAIQAIRFSALDFLLKPVQKDELVTAFHRFMDSPVEMQQKQQLYENLLRNLKSTGESEFRLSVSKGNRVYFLSTTEITYCSAQSNYSNIYLKDKTEFTLSKTLKEMEEMLRNHEFVRTHKSYLVNRDYIKSCDDEGNLTLINGVCIEVSRRRLNEIRMMLHK